MNKVKHKISTLLVISLQVSILLRDKAQLSDGHFVLLVGGPVARGADIPGTIR